MSSERRAPSGPSSAGGASVADPAGQAEDDAEVQYAEEVPHDLVCEICLAPATAPCSSPCGHFACLRCWRLALAQKPECPMDRRAPLYEADLHRDVRAQRRLMALTVLCTHESRGCTWRGAHSDLAAHLARCGAVPTRCPFAAHGCAEPPMPRRALSDHIERSTGAHLLLMSAALARVSDENAVLQQQVEVLQRCSGAYLWVVRNFEAEIGRSLYSSKFTLRSAQWYLGLDFDGEQGSAAVYLFSDGHTQRIDFRLTLLNASPARDKVHHVSDWHESYKGRGWGPLQFVQLPLANGFLSRGGLRILLEAESDPYD